MKTSLFDRPNIRQQFLTSLTLIVAVSLLGLLLHNVIGYRVVAFMLLVTVSILAMFLDVVPVLVAAFLSAVIWDLFFIPPRFMLTVGTAEDRLLLLMYFVIALINGVLTTRIRKMEKEIKDKDEKARAVNFYNTLFNALSHEMRTPITTIIGCADNLQANAPRLTEIDKKELVSEISVASIRLNQQVENLLNMSRLESGVLKIKKDWCDINDLVYKTVQRLEPNLVKYKVAIEISRNVPLVKLDFGLMEQVIYNLLLNVTQHTPDNTLITIQATFIKDRLIITIADNGSGFAAQDIEKAFDKFHRLKGPASGGTGLGLSIVKGIVEAHQGTVKLQNLPPKGAKFTIEIPTEKNMYKPSEE